MSMIWLTWPGFSLKASFVSVSFSVWRPIQPQSPRLA